MAYTKPTDINNLWAASGVKVSPETSKRSLGWIAEKPSWQYFNSILNRTDLFNAYVNERGIPEWDSITEYVAGKSYTVGSDGFIYKAKLTQSNNDPATDDGSNWRLILDELGSVTWNINYNYLQGSLVHYSGKLWVAQESVTGVLPTTDSVEWQEIITYLDMFKKMYAALYTEGDSSIIGLIYEGVDVGSYTYMIWPSDGRLYEVDAVTGTITSDFDPDDGSDSGLTGNLTNRSITTLQNEVNENRASIGSGLVSGYVDVVTPGTYTSGTLTILNGKSISDFSVVIFEGVVTGSPNIVRQSVQVNEEHFSTFLTNWDVFIGVYASGSNREVVVSYDSATTISINDSSNSFAISRVYGYLK